MQRFFHPLCLALIAVLCTSCGPSNPQTGTTNGDSVSQNPVDTSQPDGPQPNDSQPNRDASPAVDPPPGKEPPAVPADQPIETPAGKVLRHAVFFKFRESATEEDVQRIVDAFRGLPAKIDTIKDFEWGTNNSPEELDDGFTHCFLLTFADDAGRKTYLPHPDHKAFGKTLGGHHEDVFVLDYWGDANEPALEKRLRHAVFFKFKDDATPDQVKAIEEAFAALPGKIDAIKAFEWGTNNSPERHHDDFTHCFLVTFDSEEGRKAYLPHEAHLAFVDVLKPSLDKVRVLDFWSQD